MKELIKVHKSSTTGNPIINARDLYNFLEVRKDFSNWIKNLLDKWGFEENKDYVKLYYDINGNKIVVAQKGEPDNQLIRVQKIEYPLTLDTAKEISMVQNSAKGKEARRYFIAKEKELQELKLKVALEQQPKTIMLEAKNFGFHDVAKMYNTGNREISHILKNAGYLKPNGKPYEKYVLQHIFAWELYNEKYTRKRPMLTSSKGLPLMEKLMNKTIILPAVQQTLPISREIEAQIPIVPTENSASILFTSLSGIRLLADYFISCKKGQMSTLENEAFLSKFKSLSSEITKILPIKSLEIL